jgi:hypothetical protein
VRGICLGFPGVTEKLSHGAPGFFAGRQFVMLWPGGHHDQPFPHLWCAAASGVQDELIRAAPDTFFRPPYVGHRGWVGVRLDAGVDWAEVRELCEDAYRLLAPRRLVAVLDSGGEPVAAGSGRPDQPGHDPRRQRNEREPAAGVRRAADQEQPREPGPVGRPQERGGRPARRRTVDRSAGRG